jgi:hypothetical protein
MAVETFPVTGKIAVLVDLCWLVKAFEEHCVTDEEKGFL